MSAFSGFGGFRWVLHCVGVTTSRVVENDISDAFLTLGERVPYQY